MYISSGDYALTSAAATAMPGGNPSAAPYNLDPAGLVRGADGKWDRGAMQYSVGRKP